MLHASIRGEMNLHDNIKGKRILVTGGTGTIGSHLVGRLLEYGAEVVRVFSRDEHKQYEMQQTFAAQNGGRYKRLRFLLGDVRDKERLYRAMEGIDIVFHLAALKHVPACEYNPSEAVKTNVLGTQNVIDCAIEANVSAVVYASTDKAASPTNTMGASKLLAERLIVSAAEGWKGPRDIRFLSVRFGNVLNSRGSVIPLFQKQIAAGGPITVTDSAMTRFVMKIDRAVELMLKSLQFAQGGEVFVFKMPVLSIGDLAQSMVNLAAQPVDTVTIGLRPGEKLYEELMSEEESARALETREMFIVLPYDCDFDQCQYAYQGATSAKIGTYSSDSEKIMSIEEIKDLLFK